MTGDLIIAAAAVTGVAAFAYTTIIEGRRLRQIDAEHEAFMAGIERGILIHRLSPTAPPPAPPADIPPFNPHLRHASRAASAADGCAAAYRAGVFCGFMGEELADLDRLPVTTRERASS